MDNTINLTISSRQPKTIAINEIFGPTIQGEGPQIGQPCVFVRTMFCPVKCPGCDTHYTWDKTEGGRRMTASEMVAAVQNLAGADRLGTGIVISGGEPLLLWNNPVMLEFLGFITYQFRWISIETSGFVGRPIPPDELWRFLNQLTQIQYSPKITPCLKGPWTFEQMTQNTEAIFGAAQRSRFAKIALKFVIRDEADLDAVDHFCNKFYDSIRGVPIYAMPYGIEREEVMAGCEWLVPRLAQRNMILSPRLHALLWGKERKR